MPKKQVMLQYRKYKKSRPRGTGIFIETSCPHILAEYTIKEDYFILHSLVKEGLKIHRKVTLGSSSKNTAYTSLYPEITLGKNLVILYLL